MCLNCSNKVTKKIKQSPLFYSVTNYLPTQCFWCCITGVAVLFLCTRWHSLNVFWILFQRIGYGFGCVDIHPDYGWTELAWWRQYRSSLRLHHFYFPSPSAMVVCPSGYSYLQIRWTVGSVRYHAWLSSGCRTQRMHLTCYQLNIVLRDWLAALAVSRWVDISSSNLWLSKTDFLLSKLNRSAPSICYALTGNSCSIRLPESVYLSFWTADGLVRLHTASPFIRALVSLPVFPGTDVPLFFTLMVVISINCLQTYFSNMIAGYLYA